MKFLSLYKFKFKLVLQSNQSTILKLSYINETKINLPNSRNKLQYIYMDTISCCPVIPSPMCLCCVAHDLELLRILILVQNIAKTIENLNLLFQTLCNFMHNIFHKLLSFMVKSIFLYLNNSHIILRTRF